MKLQPIVLLLLLTSACAQGTPNSLSQRVASGALIVDVRSPEETKAGMYPGALNIPIEESEKRIAEFGAKDRPIVLYCRSGNRAGKVKQMLESKGYKDVTNAGSLSDMLAAK